MGLTTRLWRRRLIAAFHNQRVRASSSRYKEFQQFEVLQEHFWIAAMTLGTLLVSTES